MIKRLLYLLIGIFIGVMLTMALVFFLAPRVFSQDAEVPDVIGISVDEAVNQIRAKNLDCVVKYEKTTGINNTVYQTNPKVGTFVSVNSVVEIYAIEEKKKYMVDYTMKNYFDIFEDIKNLEKEANVLIVEEVNNDVEYGTILRQVPAVDEEINGKIVFTISKKEERIVVPNMVGWNISKIKKFEETTGLFIEYDYVNSLYEEGTVVAQSVLKGTTILKNGQNYIQVQISSGPELFIPDFSGFDIEASIYLANLLGIEYHIEYVMSNERTNKVIAQVDSDSQVVLYVSTNMEG